MLRNGFKWLRNRFFPPPPPRESRPPRNLDVVKSVNQHHERDVAELKRRGERVWCEYAGQTMGHLIPRIRVMTHPDVELTETERTYAEFVVATNERDEQFWSVWHDKAAPLRY